MYVAGRKKNATNTSKATTIEQLKSNEFRISDWDYLQFVERIRCQWKSFERARFVERYPNTSVARSREDRVLLFFFFFFFIIPREMARAPPSAKYPPDQVENWHRAEQTRELSTWLRNKNCRASEAPAGIRGKREIAKLVVHTPFNACAPTIIVKHIPFA